MGKKIIATKELRLLKIGGTWRCVLPSYKNSKKSPYLFTDSNMNWLDEIHEALKESKLRTAKEK